MKHTEVDYPESLESNRAPILKKKDKKKKKKHHRNEERSEHDEDIEMAEYSHAKRKIKKRRAPSTESDKSIVETE